MNHSQTTTEDISIGDELRNHLGIILRYWWLIVLLPTVGGVLAYYYSSNQNTLFQASSTILVQYRGTGLDLGLSDLSKSNELASTYRRLITARPFLERIPLDGASVSVTTGTNPPTINIHVRHRDAASAAAVAQDVSDSFIDYAIELRLTQIAKLQAAAAAQGIDNVQNLIAAQFTSLDNLLLLEPVSTPGRPIFPRPRRNIQIGIFLGLFLAVGLAELVNSFRDAVRSPDDLEQRFGVTSLWIIPKWSDKSIAPRELVLIVDPKSNYSEEYRKIRSNLLFANSTKRCTVMMVASPSASEGKSTILSNLALAFTHSGQRVLVIDGDMRRPTLHTTFNLPRSDMGLSNFLSDPTIGMQDVIKSTDMGVDVILSGPTPPNPAELLGSPRMKPLLEEAKAAYNIVFVDSPPLLIVADGPVVASQVEGVLVVVDAARTRPQMLRAGLKAVSNAGGQVVGVIINKYQRKFLQTGYYYDYQDYGYYTYSYRENPDGTGESPNGLIGRVKNIWSRVRKSN